MKDDRIDDSVGTRFCWAASGAELLVQRAEHIKILDASNHLREKRAIVIDDGVVIGLGRFGEEWWVLLKKDQGVVIQFGLEGEGRRLAGTEHKAISTATLSPDGKILACAAAEGAVWLWSVLDGESIGRVRFDLDEVHADMFGAPEIDELCWAPNSRHLAIRSSFPLEQVTVIDTLDRRVVGSLEE